MATSVGNIRKCLFEVTFCGQQTNTTVVQQSFSSHRFMEINNVKFKSIKSARMKLTNTHLHMLIQKIMIFVKNYKEYVDSNLAIYIRKM
jgi:hypothetical protein